MQEQLDQLREVTEDQQKIICDLQGPFMNHDHYNHEIVLLIIYSTKTAFYDSSLVFATIIEEIEDLTTRFSERGIDLTTEKKLDHVR